MAKAKKEAEGGATRKQATETKKAAAPKKAEAPKPKATTRAAATTTAKSASAEQSSAAGSAATKKKAPAKPAGAGGSVPLIDTSLAAEAAAKLVMNRALLGNAAATPPAEEPAEEAGAEKRETSTFKQLKAGLNKPASQGLGGILGTPQQGKKGNVGFGGGGQQVGRNQTFGADVNRSGVPRRTGG